MSSNQNNQSPIGVYDSGSGGLSVLKELKRTLPNESFIYFGDTKRMPYGDKTPSQLMSFCLGILDYFETKNIKAVISACNTSSAAVLPNLTKSYPFEIFGMIEPTSKYVANLNFKKVGIIATAATIKTSAYKISIEKINSNTEVIQQPCPGLVELIESNKADSQECFSLLKSYIEPLLKKDIQAVVLGCTHYPILESMIHEITNQAKTPNCLKKSDGSFTAGAKTQNCLSYKNISIFLRAYSRAPVFFSKTVLQLSHACL